MPRPEEGHDGSGDRGYYTLTMLDMRSSSRRKHLLDLPNARPRNRPREAFAKHSVAFPAGTCSQIRIFREPAQRAGKLDYRSAFYQDSAACDKYFSHATTVGADH